MVIRYMNTGMVRAGTMTSVSRIVARNALCDMVTMSRRNPPFLARTWVCVATACIETPSRFAYL